MTENATPVPANTQRIKLALIPVLALGLAAVLFWPKSQTVATAQRRPRAPLPVSPVAAGNQSVTGAARAHSWREIDLDEVMSFNPFARPAQIDALFRFGTVAASESSATPAEPAPAATVPAPFSKREVMTANVQALFQTSGITSALIDGQIVHAGDILKDGSKIVAITQEGVIIAGGD